MPTDCYTAANNVYSQLPFIATCLCQQPPYNKFYGMLIQNLVSASVLGKTQFWYKKNRYSINCNTKLTGKRKVNRPGTA